MNISRVTVAVVALGLIELTAGCGGGAASSPTPVYSQSQVGTPISSRKGEIIGVVDVTIEAPSRAAGSTGRGATVGAAAMAGAATGNPLAMAGAMGGILGGSAGAKLDNQPGQELTILLENGQTMVIVQERGEDPLSVGDKVAVQTGAATNIYGGGTTRVIRDTTAVANNGR